MPPFAALLLPLLVPATPPRLDADGIPLPAEAVCRLGSARFRLGDPGEAVEVSRDGRALFAVGYDCGHVSLLALDAATGLPRFRVPLPPDCPPRDARVVIEPQAVRVEWTTEDKRFRVRRYDPATGLPIGPPQTILRNVRRSAWLSPAGNYAAEWMEDVVRRYGIDETDYVLKLTPLRGGAPVEVVRRKDPFDPQFTPDDRYIAVLQRPAGSTVQIYETSTGKAVRELLAGGREGEIVTFAISPNGREAGGWVSRGEDDRFTFAVWDLTTGRRRDVLSNGPAPRPLSTIEFLGDGERFAYTEWFDFRVRWRVRETATGRDVGTAPCREGRCAFSRDGATLFQTSGGLVFRTDLSTGRLSGAPDPVGNVWRPRLSRSGQVVAVVRGGDGVGWSRASGWDIRTGRQTLSGHRFSEGTNPRLWIYDISPDGKWVAVRKRVGLDWSTDFQVCNAVTGVVRAEFVGHTQPVRDLKFSPDGTKVYSRAFALDALNREETKAWDAATGRVLAEAAVDALGTFDDLAWTPSPDGRMRAEFDRTRDTLRLVEAVTGKVRHTFYGHTSASHFARNVTAFSPDGRYLLTASPDAPVFVWDVRGELSKPAAPPTPGALAAAWADLASADAAAAFRAVRRLAHAPEPAVPLLRKKLPPARGPTAAELARLVAALDAPAFADREAAEKALKKLGELAGPALREAIKANASAEVRQRAERLLAPLAAGKLSAEQVRAVRAVEAVEWMGTPAAKALLAEWAAGAAGATLTTEAAAAVGRD